MSSRIYEMPPTPAPAPSPPYPLHPVPDADPIEDLRAEVGVHFDHLHARIDRVEERQGANLDLAVEAIKTANATQSKKTAAWVSIGTALITTLGAIVVAYFKVRG